LLLADQNPECNDVIPQVCIYSKREFIDSTHQPKTSGNVLQRPSGELYNGGGGGKAAFRRNALTPRILHILVRDFITRSHFRGQIYGVYHFRYIEPRICALYAYR
jgi:hypothetical protein